MTQSTIMTELRYGLGKFSGFTEDQRGDSQVLDIEHAIKKLLNDDLMMRPNNKYTLDERTIFTTMILFRNMTELLCKDDYYGLHAKLKELNDLL